MALTPKCSLNLLNDSPNHSLTKSYTQIIHNNDWSSLYSTDHSVERLNTLNPINASSTSSTSSCSTNHPCSIETQLYQEEEKILNQCLTIDNNNNNRLINDDLLLNDFYYDQDILHNPYFYNSCHDFNCELTGGTTFDHSPILNRGYTRHTRKIDSDPTILLTLLKWARIGSSQLHGDDDQIDRINYQFTSVLLLILLTLTGFRQYLSHLPLQCWIPQEFSRSWEEYAEHYCWVTNTYFANVQSTIPPVDKRTTIIRYYQWATFVFIIQAAGFFLPCLIWRLLQNHSGFHVQRIMRSALRLHCTDADSSHIITYGLARYIDNVIYQRSYKMWRSQPSKNNTHSKQKIPQNSSVLKPTQNFTSQQSSSTTTTTSSSSASASHEMSIETKLVKFENETLSPKQSSYQCRTLSNESTILRSHKKSRAPQPPVSTTSITCITTTNIPSTNSLKFNSDQIIYSLNPIIKHTSNVTSQSKLKQNVYEKTPSSLCRACGLCFTNLSSVDKTINSKSIQPLIGCSTETETTTMYTTTTTTTPTTTLVFNPMNCPQSIISQSPTNISTKHYSYRLHPKSTCCWPIKQFRSSFKSPNLLNTKKIYSINKSITIQYITYQLCNRLWLCIKYALTLICLLPICSYQWLCNRHRMKKLHHHHHNNNFLFYLYVTMKLLYLINILSQLYLMQIFLGVKSYFFGLYTLNDLINGNVWSETGHFPRVTYCDFEAKKLGKNYKYTLQCVLPLNLFLEKVYVFLWFWFVFVGCLTLYSLLKWLTRLTLAESRYNFISRFLQSWYDTQPHLGELDNVNLKLFVNNYLNLDGVFLLWLISINANDLIINELIIALWNLFETRLSALKSSSSSSKVPVSTNHNIINTLHSYDHTLHTSNSLLKSSYPLYSHHHHHHHQQQQHQQPQQWKSSYHSFTSMYPISQSTFNDHNDSTLCLNTGPLTYPQKFHSCCPVTKFGETLHVNNNNSNNIINICQSTDTFESSDSIV